MSIPRIAKALEYIGDDLVYGAVTYTGVKRKVRTVRSIWIAVALVSMFFLMGAASAITIYHLAVGFNVEQTGARFSIDFSTGSAPAVLENGRLWFTADGQHIDITDIIDENTPYIYTAVNPTTNRPSYIIVGGTPDDFGYAEIWTNNGIVGFAARYGDISTMMELTAKEFEQGLWEVPVESIDGLWLPNAIKQLEPKL